MENAYFVQIFRSGLSDCTNGGVTANAVNATLYRNDLTATELAEAKARGDVVLRLETSPKIGSNPYPRAVPMGEKRGHVWR